MRGLRGKGGKGGVDEAALQASLWLLAASFQRIGGGVRVVVSPALNNGPGIPSLRKEAS